MTTQLSPTPAGWRRRAACARRGVDPELFFPEQGGRPEPAKRICARCPVKAACLDDALASRDEYGIRGGMTPGERRRLRGRAR